MPASYYKPPEERAVLQMMEVSKSNPDAANYLHEQISRKNVEEKIRPFFDQLITHIDNFAQEVGMRCDINSSDSWAGKKSDITPFNNLHMNLANSAVEELTKQRNTEELTAGNTLDYSVSEEGQLVRGWK